MWFPGANIRGRRWLTLNARLLASLGVALVVTGLLGFALPPALSPMSGVTSYNLFHIAAGLCALTIWSTQRPGLAASFNLLFGLADLWQLVAGLAGLFPSGLFALRTADHAVHALLGVVLVFVGTRGLAALFGGTR